MNLPAHLPSSWRVAPLSSLQLGRPCEGGILSIEFFNSERLFLFTMGNFLGFTDTQFVGTEELGAVSSYQPCIVFGDSMLIGMGIRIGFYLLYWAAIISVAFGIDQQFRIWNAAWSIVALGTFISLLLNSTSRKPPCSGNSRLFF